MSKHLLSYLSTLKVAQLKHVGLLTGVPANGSKRELLSRLDASLPETLLSQPSEQLVSIDLGIRNLGICVASLTFPPTPGPQRSLDRLIQPQLNILHWARITLAPRPFSSSSANESPLPMLFTPPHLAPVAHHLVTQTLLPHWPSTLLIERQRHRSAGGAAVQEWTVRVNTLEAMIWAVLETLKQQQHRKPRNGDALVRNSVENEGEGFPACWAVEPGRVARFWFNDGASHRLHEGLLRELDIDMAGARSRGERRKSESKRGRGRKTKTDVKKEKIELVRSWLETRSDAPFDLTFADEAAKVRDLLLQPPRRNGPRNLTNAEAKEMPEDFKAGKLDDLADCLLQATTWVQWEWNRRRIMHALESRNG